MITTDNVPSPTAVRADDAPDQAPDGRTIALCLSGGGLRATLFHFGVIKALRTHADSGGRTALSSVREIYSVSGGSINAAHLVRNWADYNGSDFVKQQDQLIAFAHRNIRDRIVRRWLLVRWFGKLMTVAPKPAWIARRLRGRDASRGYWLQREYRKLLGAESIADCYAKAGGDPPPHVHILSTSFTSGDLCSFSETKFEVEPNPLVRRAAAGGSALAAGPNAPTQGPRRAHGGHVPLAFAVAASSAFPPLFPPVRVTSTMLRHPPDEFFNDGILLSDGGVFDNLGYEKFALNHARAAVKVDTLVASNAGGSFRTSSEETYSDIISRNIRASDILMRRVGVTTNLAAAGLVGSQAGLTYFDLQIGDSDADPILQPATQESLRLVRTDLDTFGDDLARMLIDHGYRVTARALRGTGWTPVGNADWCVTKGADEHFAGVAEKAARRSLMKPLLFGIGDWKGVLAIWAVIAIVAGAIVSLGWNAYANNQAQAALADEKRKADEAERKANSAELAAQKDEANRTSNELEAVRRAVAAGNIPAARRLLAVAVVQSEKLAASTSVVTRPTPISLNQRQVDQVIDEKPSFIIAPAGEQRDQRVFIQFAGILTRAQITALNQGLKGAGWRVQGGSGERTPKASGLNQVRYAEGNEAAAQDLADALNRSGIVPGKTIKPQRLDIVGPNLEAWISR